ncbi:MAG: alpha/beta hydrolase [Spirochaetia bacterium]|nr:alpha/beta hydrolase [Spirochaetia bacterium]
MIIVYLVIIYLILVLVFGVVAFYLMFYPSCKTSEFTRANGLEKSEFSQNFLDQSWVDFEIPSPQGYRISGNYLAAKTGLPSAPTALFVHGITWTRYGMYKYMQPFFKQGWNVASIDLAGHGKTRAPRRYYPTFGYYEKFDVKSAVDFLKTRFPESVLFGVVGESLGAGSVLQYSAIANGAVDFVIADCPFASARRELLYQVRKLGFPPFFAQHVSLIVAVLVRMTKKFSFDDASPEKAVLESQIPILLVHGLEDRYVPTWMSLHLYNIRKKAGIAATSLLLVPGARHAKSYMTDPELWERTAFSFISNIKPS